MPDGGPREGREGTSPGAIVEAVRPGHRERTGAPRHGAREASSPPCTRQDELRYGLREGFHGDVAWCRDSFRKLDTRWRMDEPDRLPHAHLHSTAAASPRR